MKKMNRKEIIQEVCEQIKLEWIKFLLWFGTRPGRDIDLLIVLKNGIKVRLCESSKSKLDVLMVDHNEFMKRLALLDPAFTDPLITGFVLLGDKKEIGLLRSKVVRSFPFLKKVPRKTIQFLRERACKRLQNAGTFLQKKGNSALYSFLTELSWAYGYYAFLKYYEHSPKFLPITFDHLLIINRRIAFKQVMSALELAKSGESINRPRMISLFKKTQKMLGVA